MTRALTALVFAALGMGCALDTSIDTRIPNRRLSYEKCVDVAYEVVDIWKEDALSKISTCRGGPFNMDVEYRRYDKYTRIAEDTCYQEAGKFYYDGDIKCFDDAKTWRDVARCDMASPYGKTLQALIMNYNAALDSIC
jgi:hypothetical protein